MPEGPSIFLMKEDLQKFADKKVIDADGSAISNKKIIINQTLKEIKTFGKLTFLVFEKFSFRIHLLMFGSYSLSEKEHIRKSLRLHMKFKSGEIFFYTCSVKVIDNEQLNTIDWEADVMSADWNPEKAKNKMLKDPEMMICDALMNQDIFSGVGNIIKNEVLFRAGLHPESKTGKIPSDKLKEIIEEAKNYSFDFLKWKRINQLKRHFIIYHKDICPKCSGKVTKKDTGKGKRTSFFCENDQKLY